MKLVLTKYSIVSIAIVLLITFFNTQQYSIFAQKNNRIALDLEKLDYRDFDFTPNEAIKIKKTGDNVIWAGKIDSIEVKKEENAITLLFYCSHRYFDNVSEKLIYNGGFTIKESGDGAFITNIISTEMDENSANMMKSVFTKPGTFILVVGEIQDFPENKGQTNVFLKSLSFYTVIK